MRAHLIALVAVTLCASAMSQGQGRFRPPEAVRCDRNHLTSFSGEVTSYKRTASELKLRMRTDENTQERFHLHGTSDQLRAQLLFNQQSFEPKDWNKIEQSASRLKPRVRATVWQCKEPKRVIVDWQSPPE